MGIPFGRYQLLKKIASGGMGQVLLAKKGQDDFEKLVVLKRILPHLVEDEEFFTMFRDEAKITMRLDHPNIARINEFGVEGGVHYIEMEYVAGEDMRRIEKRAAAVGKGIPIGVIIRIIADAAAGLDFAHKARDAKGAPLNLVHRDVSPQNVLVGFDGSVKLIDFGVAKAAGRSQHTATGILKGKFPYMSPEQAQGEELDCRSDVFALGIVLWEQLTGRRLFKGENDLATQRLVRACQVPAPSSVEPSVPTGLDPIALKALAKEPKDRFQDAAELRNALEDFALHNAIPTSASNLSSFMRELYAERIAKEADPRFFEEDSGLTDLDVGGLSKPANTGGATVLDRNKLPADGAGTQVLGPVTLAVPPSTPSPLPRVLAAIAVAAVLGVGGWLALKSPPEVKPVEVPVKPIVEAPLVVPPLVVRIESEPNGANVELGRQPHGPDALRSPGGEGEAARDAQALGGRLRNGRGHAQRHDRVDPVAGAQEEARRGEDRHRRQLREEPRHQDDPMKPSEQPLRCERHGAAAGWKCTVCHQVLCPDCAALKVVSPITLMACGRCGEMVEPLIRKKSQTASLAQRLPEAFLFPFRGEGLPAWLGISMFLWVLSFLGGLGALIGWGGGAGELLRADPLHRARRRVARAVRLPGAAPVDPHAAGALQPGDLSPRGAGHPAPSTWGCRGSSGWPWCLAALWSPTAFIGAAANTSLVDLINPVRVLGATARIGKDFGVYLGALLGVGVLMLASWPLAVLVNRYLLVPVLGGVATADGADLRALRGRAHRRPGVDAARPGVRLGRGAGPVRAGARRPEAARRAAGEGEHAAAAPPFVHRAGAGARARAATRADVRSLRRARAEPRRGEAARGGAARRGPAAQLLRAVGPLHPQGDGRRAGRRGPRWLPLHRAGRLRAAELREQDQ